MSNKRGKEEHNVLFAMNETRGLVMLSYLKRGWEKSIRERFNHKSELLAQMRHNLFYIEFEKL